MSRYFQRIATLDRQGAPGRNTVSPFWSAKPPIAPAAQSARGASHEVGVVSAPTAQPSTGASPEAVVTSAPTAPTEASTEAQPSPRAEAVSRMTEAESVATDPSAPRSSGARPDKLAQTPIGREEPRSIGETISSDLSRMGFSLEGDEAAVATALPSPTDDRLPSTAASPPPTPQRTLTASSTEPSTPPRKAVPEAPLARSHLDPVASPRMSSSSPAVPPTTLWPQAVPEMSDVDLAPEPNRQPIPSEQIPLVRGPMSNAQLRARAPTAPGDEHTVVPTPPGPRARPDVKVSIGTVNLSTETAREAPPPAPQPPPARTALSTSGIWSGGRAFTRSYVRRG